MKFDRIAPNVQQVCTFGVKSNTQPITHRKFSYTYRMIILLEGSMLLHTEDREWVCGPGDVIYLPSCQNYRTDFCPPRYRSISISFDMLHDRKQESKRSKTYFAYADESKNAELYSTRVDFDDLPVFNAGFVAHHFPGAVKRAQRCLELWGSPDQFAHLLINAYTAEFLAELARHLDRTGKTPRSVVAERVMDYVEAHHTEKLTCEKIAAVFSYHPATLNRIMHEFYHCSLHEAIVRAKINGAIVLLTESDMSVTDIAYYLSFYDSAHFTKTFREVTGRNPSDIRKKEE